MSKQHKKALIGGIILVIVAALLYFIPWPTRVNLALDAVKLDAEGNEIGTTQIYIKGFMLNYLFREDRLDITIDPFDDLKYVLLAGDGTGQEGEISRFDNAHGLVYLWLNLHGWNTRANDTAICQLYFTEEFDCFAFVSHPFGHESVYYVASASGNYTTQQVIEYFNGLVPGLSQN